MEGLLVVKIDEDGLPLEVEDGRPALMARSLANALKLCKKKMLRLNEGKVHTDADLEHFESALDLMESDCASLPEPAAVSGEGKAPAPASDARAYHACKQLLQECRDLLQQMRGSAVVLPPALRPTYARLVELRRRMAHMRQRRDHTLLEVVPLQAELDELDAERVASGGFGSELEPAPAGEPSPGQHACDEVLNACYDLLADALHSATDIPPAMQRAYNQLRRIKNSLRKLGGAKEHHTVQELQHYQMLLEKLDASGLAPEGQGGEGEQQAEALRGHEAAQKMLKECYDLIEGLMDSAVDMRPDVKGVHHRLEDYRHHLENMALRPHTYKELLDVQLALNGVDDDRQAHAGVFAGDASTGRACSVLLNHCYRLLHDLYGTATAGDAEQ